MLAETLAYHNPLYPKKDENVYFCLEKLYGEVESVTLYEYVEDISSITDIYSFPENIAYNEITSWKQPIQFPICYPRGNSLGENQRIFYKFEVKGIGSQPLYSHLLSFVTQPYLNNKSRYPAPVYIVNPDITKSYNIVFIPDDTMSGKLDIFHEYVLNQLKESFFKEPHLNRFRFNFNFYINRFPAAAGDHSNGNRRLPDNHKEIFLYNMKAILHDITDNQDYCDSLYYIGSEYNKFGTLTHETGHALFELSDEYKDANLKFNRRDNNEYPNLWDAQQNILDYCRDETIDTNRIVSFIVGRANPRSFWKICNDNCNMNNSGKASGKYDIACQNRINYVLSDKSTFSQTVKEFEMYSSDKKIVQKLNTFLENDLYNNPKKITEYTEVLLVAVSYIDNSFHIKPHKFSIQPGSVPYKIGKEDRFYIQFLDENQQSIYAFTMEHPAIIRRCMKGETIVLKQNKMEFYLAVPLDVAIKFVRFHEENKLVSHEELNVSSILEQFLFT